MKFTNIIRIVFYLFAVAVLLVAIHPVFHFHHHSDDPQEIATENIKVRNLDVDVSFWLPGKTNVIRGKNFYQVFDKKVLLMENMSLYEGQYDANYDFHGVGMLTPNPEGADRGEIKFGEWRHGDLVKENPLINEVNLEKTSRFCEILSWHLNAYAIVLLPEIKWSAAEFYVEFQNKTEQEISKVDLYVEVRSAKDDMVFQRILLEDAFDGQVFSPGEAQKWMTRKFYLFWADEGFYIRVKPYRVYYEGASHFNSA